MDWISVKERLPPKGVWYDPYLVAIDGKVRYACWQGGHWCDGDVAVFGGVTHWMPLPRPPKGDSDGR